MQLLKSIEYQKGEKFWSGLEVVIAMRKKLIQTRIEYIEQLIKGKKMIHVGCVDHLPLIKEKIKQGTWLHERLSDKASKCLGVDINHEGVDYLKKELGYEDIICCDLTKNKNEAIVSQKWDYMILGEVIEHINNPTNFLSIIKENYSAHVDKIIISTPNGFRLDNFIFLFRHIECINTDHRYWFSPYTLSKAAIQAGITVEQCDMVHGYKIPRRSVVRQFLRFFPGFCNTIILVGKL